MKRLLFYTILMGLVLGCAVAKNNQKTPYLENTSLPDFILGAWEGAREEVVNGQKQFVKYEVNFIDENSLRFSSMSTSDGFNDEFEYEFIEDNKISVENRRTSGGYWKLSRFDESLQICLWTDSDCLLFTRKQ